MCMIQDKNARERERVILLYNIDRFIIEEKIAITIKCKREREREKFFCCCLLTCVYVQEQSRMC